jgi:hypothetical protein
MAVLIHTCFLTADYTIVHGRHRFKYFLDLRECDIEFICHVGSFSS